MKLSVAIVVATSLCAQSTVILTGRVTDSVTGLPIEQAAITLDQGSYHGSMKLTDQSGGFTFDDVPPGTVSVRIRKEDYLLFENTNPQDTSIEVTADSHERNFTLIPAGSIRGKITGEGKPEERIVVELLKEDFGAGFSQYIRWAPLGVPTGADGEFAFIGLEPGRYLVNAHATES
ncbi:MAG TPA: carboxypeptidase regulatory-like domain-containing protein, partial [Bryobacteraceae bacterium]